MMPREFIRIRLIMLKRIRESLVQVWHKIVYSDEGWQKYIQNILKEGLSTDGCDKLSFRLVLHGINCRNQRSGLLSATFYDKNSKILSFVNLNEI